MIGNDCIPKFPIFAKSMNTVSNTSIIPYFSEIYGNRIRIE
jgi:hypothetical protein